MTKQKNHFPPMKIFFLCLLMANFAIAKLEEVQYADPMELPYTEYQCRDYDDKGRVVLGPQIKKKGSLKITIAHKSTLIFDVVIEEMPNITDIVFSGSLEKKRGDYTIGGVIHSDRKGLESIEMIISPKNSTFSFYIGADGFACEFQSTSNYFSNSVVWENQIAEFDQLIKKYRPGIPGTF